MRSIVPVPAVWETLSSKLILDNEGKECGRHRLPITCLPFWRTICDQNKKKWGNNLTFSVYFEPSGSPCASIYFDLWKIWRQWWKKPHTISRFFLDHFFLCFSFAFCFGDQLLKLPLCLVAHLCHFCSRIQIMWDLYKIYLNSNSQRLRAKASTKITNSFVIVSN